MPAITVAAVQKLAMTVGLVCFGSGATLTGQKLTQPKPRVEKAARHAPPVRRVRAAPPTSVVAGPIKTVLPCEVASPGLPPLNGFQSGIPGLFDGYPIEGGLVRIVEGGGGGPGPGFVPPGPGTPGTPSFPPVAGIPDPETWSLMVAGFVIAGVASRRQRLKEQNHG